VEPVGMQGSPLSEPSASVGIGKHTSFPQKLVLYYTIDTLFTLLVSKTGGQVQSDEGSACKLESHAKKRNPAHVFRPCQHSGSRGVGSGGT
jgi:hypothetical protein